MTLSKPKSSWLSAHHVPCTVDGGTRDTTVDKTHRCGPSCSGAHSLMRKIDTDYVMTRGLSVANSEECRALVAQRQRIWKDPPRKRSRSYEINRVKECKRTLQAEGAAWARVLLRQRRACRVWGMKEGQSSWSAEGMGGGVSFIYVLWFYWAESGITWAIFLNQLALVSILLPPVPGPDGDPAWTHPGCPTAQVHCPSPLSTHCCTSGVPCGPCLCLVWWGCDTWCVCVCVWRGIHK